MYFVGYLPGCVYNVLFAGQLCDLCREGRKKVESRTDRAATSDLRDEDEKMAPISSIVAFIVFFRGNFSEKMVSTIRHFKIYIVIMSLNEN